MTYVPEERRIYWTSYNGHIIRSGLDGSGEEIFLRNGESPEVGLLIVYAENQLPYQCER